MANQPSHKLVGCFIKEFLMFPKYPRTSWHNTAMILALLGVAFAASMAMAAPVTFVHENSGASSVFLAGDFNGWSDGSDKMQNDGGTWTLTLELDPGSYMYKFVADGNWLQDESNPNASDDGFGGKNSLVNVVGDAAMFAAGGEGSGLAAPVAPAIAETVATGGDVTVEFQVTAPGAGSVFLAGDFNGWSDSANKMLEKDGTWSLAMNLAPGQYGYKFVIDGSWTQDEANPQSNDDGFGGKNSLVDVKAGSSKMAAASGAGAAVSSTSGTAASDGDKALRSVEFSYTPVISGVGGIFLAGSFNDWNDSKTKMTDPDNDGTYTVTLLLAPGSYQYKYVVDGNWQADPNNPEGSEDGFGGQNSVLNVDTSFATIEIELGDGIIFSDDLEPVFDYSTCNPLTDTEIAITARAHKGDVEELVLAYSVSGGPWQEIIMPAVEQDPAYQYYRVNVSINSPGDKLDFMVQYRDADTREYFGMNGMGTRDAVVPFSWTAAQYPPFFTPEWAKDGIIYQIFPERFANGDKSNDPDFTEEWYQGANKLPASGKTNSEYFHMENDWYDAKGLIKSPYRTDGKPDYFSFYGGDIKGIEEKLDYLNDLGITVIYFNPLNQGMSNHKYDPVDYLKIDPHFGTTEEFKGFIKACHEHGIRVVVDMAFNHTGNWHFAFRDAVEKGPKSEYYNWYEFHRWPLPQNRDFNASDYYDCWWGFGLHPNLNFDLKLANAAENNIEDISDATPNMPVVEYVLSVADFWLGELDIDGFRLDVPNEVPFWFWKLFNERCKTIKPDSWLVGELWGNAGRWIGPHCFDSTMNYKFFRDPVMDFFGKGALSASDFDQRLGPGRFQYPPQSVAVMMNLADSHDTIRFLTSAKDERRLMLAAMFGMTYVGMPHIWYGDEIGMVGGKDPDCRRPMDWRYEGDPRRQALRDYYGTITRMRRDTPVLSRGAFTALNTTGKGYAFARSLDGKLALAMFNAGATPVTMTISGKELKELVGPDGTLNLKVMVGPESFRDAAPGVLQVGHTIGFGSGDVEITLPGLSGAVLLN
jgi:cyclomaltodextrinase / maltogenic alpha-amylase / neopullulanase